MNWDGWQSKAMNKLTIRLVIYCLHSIFNMHNVSLVSENESIIVH